LHGPEEAGPCNAFGKNIFKKREEGWYLATSPYYEKNLLSNFLYTVIISRKHEEIMLFV